jgi:hypothetical protein
MLVDVIFKQDGMQIYTWETSISNTSIEDMAEAVCATGLAEDDRAIQFSIVKHDSELEFANGSIELQWFN